MGSSGHGGRTYRSARFIAQRAFLDSSLLGVAYVNRRRGYEEWRITSSTRLVMDGFPRSANSYARHAFLLAQGDSRVCAGHAHSPALLLHAQRRGLPTLLIVRDPADSAASLIQYMPFLTPAIALRAYVRFHAPLLARHEGILVADFAAVIEDMGAVIRDLNRRFHTDFTPYEKSDQNETLVRVAVEDMGARRQGRRLSEFTVSRPSAMRLPSSAVMSGLDAKGERLLREGRGLYQRLLSAGGSAR